MPINWSSSSPAAKKPHSDTVVIVQLHCRAEDSTVDVTVPHAHRLRKEVGKEVEMFFSKLAQTKRFNVANKDLRCATTSHGMAAAEADVLAVLSTCTFEHKVKKHAL